MSTSPRGETVSPPGLLVPPERTVMAVHTPSAVRATRRIRRTRDSVTKIASSPQRADGGAADRQSGPDSTADPPMPSSSKPACSPQPPPPPKPFQLGPPMMVLMALVRTSRLRSESLLKSAITSVKPSPIATMPEGSSKRAAGPTPSRKPSCSEAPATSKVSVCSGSSLRIVLSAATVCVRRP